MRQLSGAYRRSGTIGGACDSQMPWGQQNRDVNCAGVDKKWCSWRAWQWASSAVLSRTMYHPADPPCGCLTPLGDLHNYAPPAAPYTPDLAHGLQQLLQEQGQNQQQQQLQQLQESQQKVQIVEQVQPCRCQAGELGEHEGQCQVQHPQQHSQPPSPPPPPVQQQQQQQQQQGKDYHGIVHDSVVPHQLQQQEGQDATQQPSHDSLVGGRGSTSTSCGMIHDSSDLNSAMSSATTVDPSRRPCDSCEGSSSSSSSSSSSNGPVGQPQHGGAANIQQGPVAEPAAATTRAAAAAPSPEADTALHVAPDSAAISGDGHFDEDQGCYKIVARRRCAGLKLLLTHCHNLWLSSSTACTTTAQNCVSVESM